MIMLQDQKVEIMLDSITCSNAGTAKGYLDTLGWDHARIMFTHGTAASDAVSMAALAITEATNSAAATAIPAFTGTTNTVTVAGTSGFIIPSGTSSVQQLIAFDIDLRKRERYLAVNATNCTVASNWACIAILSRGRQVPGSDAGSMTTEVVG